MASLALKRVLSFSSWVRVVARPASSRSRFFNTNARDYNLDDIEFEVDESLVVLYPFAASRDVRQTRKVMDQFLRHNCFAKETVDGLHLRVYMPGLGREDVELSLERKTLIIEGESLRNKFKALDPTSTQCHSNSRYIAKLDLPDELCNIDSIKTDMKNGVLNVFIPRIDKEEEERKRGLMFHL